MSWISPIITGSSQQDWQRRWLAHEAESGLAGKLQAYCDYRNYGTAVTFSSPYVVGVISVDAPPRDHEVEVSAFVNMSWTTATALNAMLTLYAGTATMATAALVSASATGTFHCFLAASREASDRETWRLELSRVSDNDTVTLTNTGLRASFTRMKRLPVLED